jgi:pimeloyl-ACP methyl ester carboxylesterase
VLDYDLRIAEPFRVPGAEAGPDMWGALAGLAEVPVLLVRGARSDLLGEGVATRMAAALPGAEAVTVPDVGHAPMLDEPAADASIRRWLARLDQGAGRA